MANPPPRHPAYADDLTASIAQGDLLGVRAHFDKVFWGDSEQRPTWQHLQIAVMRGDVPMARLLVTWGARASEGDLAALQKVAPKKYPEYLQTLRRSGHGISPKALRDSLAQAAALPDTADNESLAETVIKSYVDGAFIDYRAERIPKEWRQVLGHMQAEGSPEALIGGGALRDLFNGRAIKDVDIFLETRGSEKQNRKFLQRVFQKAGLPITSQTVKVGAYGALQSKEIPDPRKEVFQPRINNGYGTFRAASHSEAWTIIAGKDKTEYNVVFIDGPLGKALSSASVKPGAAARTMIRAFDLGLCQIGFDGRQLVTTQAYRDDVRGKKISLIEENGTSQQHIQRIVKKYSDWELTDAAQKAMKPKPPPLRRSYGGFYY